MANSCPCFEESAVAGGLGEDSAKVVLFKKSDGFPDGARAVFFAVARRAGPAIVAKGNHQSKIWARESTRHVSNCVRAVVGGIGIATAGGEESSWNLPVAQGGICRVDKG